MIKYTERLILGLLVASVTTNDNPDEEIKTLPPHMDNELNELNDITYYNNPSQRECVDCNCYLGNVYDWLEDTYKYLYIHLEGLIIESHHYYFVCGYRGLWH